MICDTPTDSRPGCRLAALRRTAGRAFVPEAAALRGSARAGWMAFYLPSLGTFLRLAASPFPRLGVE